MVDRAVRDLGRIFPEVAEVEFRQLLLSLHFAQLECLRCDTEITSSHDRKTLELWHVL